MVKKKASFRKLGGVTTEKGASKKKWADSDDEDEFAMEEQSQQPSKVIRVIESQAQHKASAKRQDNDEEDDDDDDAPEETSTIVAKNAVLGSQGSVASAIAKKKAEEKQKRKEKQEVFEKRRAEEALTKATAAAAVSDDDNEELEGSQSSESPGKEGSESNEEGNHESERNGVPSEGIRVSRLPQSLLETPDEGPIEIERVKSKKPPVQPHVKVDPADAPLVRIHKRLESDFDIAEPVSKETKRRKVRGEKDVKGFKAVPVNEMAKMRGRPVSDAARTFKTRAVEARVPRANAILNMSARGSGFLPAFVRGALQ
ncbi:hypothetical protein BJ742DRAFT_891062 [Cladochytrium replicatum]|nr:hypothetical protein BJ742DRAFT_891062 [Cladochytrium replicatum]